MSENVSLPQPRASERLRERWRSGNAPMLDAFLAEIGPLDSTELAAVIRVDQAEQWAAGNRVRVEEYFRRYPQAIADTEDAIDLIHSEYLLAERAGESPEIETFLRRFPAHEETLRLQIDLHRAVSSKDTSLASGDASSAALPSTLPRRISAIRRGAWAPSISRKMRN